ncbi:MAG: ABC transporter permease [Lachnospiraceae bacterium]|nr:ABC transporter permease [Lachnospiraceae bacterium]
MMISMHTFKAFLLILRKNMPSIMVYTGICIALIFMISSNNAEDVENKYKGKEIPFTIIDRDGGKFGDTIKEYLSKKNDYKECKDDIDNLRNNIFYRNVYYVLIIPEGYEDAVLSGKSMELENMKVKDSALGYYVDLEVNQFMTAFRSYIAAGYDMDNALKSTLKSLDEDIKVTMSDAQKDGGYNRSYYYYGIIPYIFMSVIMAAVGPVYIAFNKIDVRTRINCSADRFRKRNFCLLLSTILVGVLVWLLFNLMPIIIYHNDMSMVEILFNLLNTFCMSLVAMSLAFMCGNLANSNNIFQGMVNVVSMGLAFIGGVFVPLEVLSDNMLKLSKITPTYWYVVANNAIVDIADLDSRKVFSGMGMQLLFAVAILGISLVAIKKFRTRD